MLAEASLGLGRSLIEGWLAGIYLPACAANSLAAEPVALQFSLVQPLLAHPLLQLPLEPGLLLFEARQFLGGASPCLGEGCLFTALLLCDPGDLGLPGALV